MKPRSGPTTRPAGSPPTVLELLNKAAGYLGRRGAAAPRLDAEVLLAHALGTDRLHLYVDHDRPLEPAEVGRYRELVAARGRGVPVAYLTGSREFWGLPFFVEPGVLVPRPDTEHLLEAALAVLKGPSPPRGDGGVADVGTGSGILAVCLARELPAVRVWATDTSPRALAVAGRNAEAHAVASRVTFCAGDLLEPLLARGLAGRLAAVVSNPPYVARSEWQDLPAEVRNGEPREALDGGEDGLAVYRRLLPQARRALVRGGLLAVEVAAARADATASLLASGGWEEVELLPDYAGRPRVLRARRGEGAG